MHKITPYGTAKCKYIQNFYKKEINLESANPNECKVG